MTLYSFDFYDSRTQLLRLGHFGVQVTRERFGKKGSI